MNLDEKLNKIADTLLEMLTKEDKNLPNLMKNRFEEARKEKVKISVEKDENGDAKTHIEGSTFGILFTLAGLEKTILNDLGVSNDMFDTIKHMVGVKEVK